MSVSSRGTRPRERQGARRDEESQHGRGFPGMGATVQTRARAGEGWRWRRAGRPVLGQSCRCTRW